MPSQRSMHCSCNRAGREPSFTEKRMSRLYNQTGPGMDYTIIVKEPPDHLRDHGRKHLQFAIIPYTLNAREPPGCPQRLARCVAMWCDAQRRVAERCDAPRRAALPAVTSISPTRLID